MLYQLTISDVRRIAEDYFNFKKNTLKYKPLKNSRDISVPRHIVQYWCVKHKKEHGWTLTDIANNIGNTDHATVLHAKDNINNLLDINYKFNELSIKEHIQNISDKIRDYILERSSFNSINKLVIDRVFTYLKKIDTFLDFKYESKSPREVYIKRVVKLLGIKKDSYKLLLPNKYIHKVRFIKVFSVIPLTDNVIRIAYIDLTNFTDSYAEIFDFTIDELREMRFRKLDNNDLISLKKLFSTEL